MELTRIAWRLLAVTWALASIANGYAYLPVRNPCANLSLSPWQSGACKQQSCFNRKRHVQRRFTGVFAEPSAEHTADAGDDRKRKILFLRTSTGKGTQECYEALTKAGGDLRAALDIIRSGMDNYVASSGALLIYPYNVLLGGGESAPVVDLLHGRVATVMTPDMAAVLELRCETDFVARNNVFMALAKSLANSALAVMRSADASAQELDAECVGNKMMEARCIRCSKTPREAAALAKMALHERLIVTRLGFIKAAPQECLTSYLHGALVATHPLNKVGSAAALLKYTLTGAPDSAAGSSAVPAAADLLTPITHDHESVPETNCVSVGAECIYAEMPAVEPSLLSDGDVGLTRSIKTFTKQVTQHIVGARPVAMTLDDYDPEKVSAARSELEAEALASGKPKDTVDRIVSGRLRKQFGEFVLMEQSRKTTMCRNGRSTAASPPWAAPCRTSRRGTARSWS
ncbi:elongation factor TS, putative [Babesia bigemina]|uniref:Elongation factor TS, putative n=1 Tax=Babesia bigemina TaxID=5866 RepID=A0A061D569_BABBI|nr:elongation factor TS, putative [Babesia bigemina]CDR95192.1 elongation factor TS, putative [Babesia bigemina]|eukprot:XP_012767378.1 elongation factor TS, putative [Babesia bigemina]